MAFAELENIKIYYEIYGKGDPIVLIAGYTGDHSFWEAMASGLAEYFQVLVFDNRGIGKTKDDGRSFSIETMAIDTVRLIEHLNWQKPIVIGQSMGGAIAQTLAINYPDKLDKLIILNSVEKFNTIALMALENILNLRKANIDFDLLVESALPWVCSGAYLLGQEHIDAFKESIKNNPAPQSIEDQERQLSALKLFDSRAWSQKIKCPSLVIAATEDLISPLSECKKLANNIRAKFAEVPGGHASPLEHPKQLNEIILNFLK